MTMTKTEEAEAEEGEEEEETSAGGQYVELESDRTIVAIAAQFWDGKGDLTLYYRLTE